MIAKINPPSGNIIVYRVDYHRPPRVLELQGYANVGSEVSCGNETCRIDLLLGFDTPCYGEVKKVTLR